MTKKREGSRKRRKNRGNSTNSTSVTASSNTRSLNDDGITTTKRTREANPRLRHLQEEQELQDTRICKQPQLKQAKGSKKIN